MMSSVLGIDGGGSKTVCILMNSFGKVLGRGEAGASNYQSIGTEAALTSIQHAVHAAVIEGLKLTDTIKVEAICFGLAGVGRLQDTEVVKDIFESLKNCQALPIDWAVHSSCVVICNDAFIALVGGIGGDVGVAVVAGTGSIVLGRNSQGKTKRVGGWGYILGDEGSGYKIAVAGMQAALKAYDGREKLTRIVDDFKQYLGLASIEDLIEVIYRRGWSVKEIAALALIVDNAAAQGDEVANRIINEAVQELVKATLTVLEALFEPRELMEVVTVGSVWQSKCKIRERFTASVVGRFPGVKVILPRHEPAYGACLLALRRLAGQIAF
jgi:N-acetylglucosamine kinase